MFSRNLPWLLGATGIVIIGFELASAQDIGGGGGPPNVSSGGGPITMPDGGLDWRYLQLTGGTLAGGLSVDGGVTLSNGVTIDGVSGTLIPQATNIARAGTMTESSNPFAYPANLANDGNDGTGGTDLTFSHTNNGSGEWLAVDLGGVHIVREMIIRKVQNYQDRPRYYTIQKADDSGFTTNVVNIATVDNADQNYTLTLATPTPGRYWRILSTGEQYVQIVEWEIYESLAGPLLTVNGAANLAGDTDVLGALYAASVHVDGGVTVHGDVAVTGNFAAASAYVDGGATVNGTTVMRKAIVNGTNSWLAFNDDANQCVRFRWQSGTLYYEYANQPCTTWGGMGSLSTDGVFAPLHITTTGQLALRGYLANDLGNVKVNDTLEFYSTGGVVSALPTCDRVMVAGYARDSATMSLCRCAKNSSAWAWEAVGTGNCTPP